MQYCTRIRTDFAQDSAWLTDSRIHKLQKRMCLQLKPQSRNEGPVLVREILLAEFHRFTRRG